MKILGIHDGHNASACLMINGKIEYLVQEERLTKEKNYSGFPFNSINLILQKSGLTPADIDKVGLNGYYMPKAMDRKGILDYYKGLCRESSINISRFKNRLKNVQLLSHIVTQKNQKERIDNVLKAGFKASAIEFVDHHLAHASSAYYGNGEFDRDVLVLTNDGAGDRVCATVSVGKDGKLTRIAEVHENHSIGILYAVFTFLTGMVPLEHEYKLMGMAPYADRKGARKIADEFRSMFRTSDDGLTWEFTKGYSIFGSMPYFREFLFLKRFDHLMGGLQIFTEEFLKAWVQACIRKTGIKRIALAGGTFMNVKANKILMDLPEVEKIFVYPSCGDESNAAGVCYNLAARFRAKEIEPLGPVYFGISFSSGEVERSFKNYTFKHSYSISKPDNIEKSVAQLLAEGYVVARFKNREEFGARSLGNRAILANPVKPDVIKEINEMIKNRDFWMPFASSMLDTDMDKYLTWQSSKNSPDYMIMTYDTRAEHQKEIAGGIHPYDKTVRPQRVSKEHNADYWNLINEFKQITGIGSIVNTSLNLHGLPLVHSPEDAFHVLENSSLKFLAIEDYLITKNN